MSLVLVLSVTWLTLVTVVLGACVAAARADRDAAEQTEGLSIAPAVVGPFDLLDAPTDGASMAREIHHRRPPRTPRRGAHHGSGHAKLLRR